MKIIKTIFTSIVLLVISSFILSFILTLLSSKIDNQTTIDTLTEISTLLVFFIVSVYVGKKIGSKGIFIAMLLIVIYLLSSLIFKNIDLSFIGTLLMFSKIFIITSGSIIGVNI